MPCLVVISAQLVLQTTVEIPSTHRLDIFRGTPFIPFTPFSMKHFVPYMIEDTLFLFFFLSVSFWKCRYSDTNNAWIGLAYSWEYFFTLVQHRYLPHILVDCVCMYTLEGFKWWCEVSFVTIPYGSTFLILLKTWGESPRRVALRRRTLRVLRFGVNS